MGDENTRRNDIQELSFNEILNHRVLHVYLVVDPLKKYKRRSLNVFTIEKINIINSCKRKNLEFVVIFILKSSTQNVQNGSRVLSHTVYLV